MLGRKTGACKEILFSPHRSYMFFNLLRCFGLQWSRKHLIFLLVAAPPKSPESSMRGAGHSPASWHWLYSCSLCTLHTHTHIPLYSKDVLFSSFPLKGSISSLCLPVLPLQQLLSASCSGTAACSAAPAAPGIGISPKLGIKAMYIKVFISLRDELFKLIFNSGFHFHSVCLCRVNLRPANSTITQLLELGFEAQQCQKMQRI